MALLSGCRSPPWTRRLESPHLTLRTSLRFGQPVGWWTQQCNPEPRAWGQQVTPALKGMYCDPVVHCVLTLLFFGSTECCAVLPPQVSLCTGQAASPKLLWGPLPPAPSPSGLCMVAQGVSPALRVCAPSGSAWPPGPIHPSSRIRPSSPCPGPHSPLRRSLSSRLCQEWC